MLIEIRSTHERVKKRRKQQKARFKILANDDRGCKFAQPPKLGIGQIINVPVIVCDHMNLLSARALLYRRDTGSVHMMTKMTHHSLQNCR